MRKSVFVSALLCVFGVNAVGQTFSSGSTGADGALNITASGVTTTIQLPPSGILNYTTINVVAGAGLTFSPNLQNTPAVILAQGAVNIAGAIGVNASGYVPGGNLGYYYEVPGAGGFYGGAPGQPGLGPGGGQLTGQTAGTWVGPLSLVPIIGGSGGSGACNATTQSGGAGGGAIVIASSVSISVTSGASIAANAGPSNGCPGSAGAIRLVSNSINVAGTLLASVVRLEAPLNALAYTGSGTTPVRSTINPEITPANPPVLAIVSIGGYPVPSYSGSSFSTVDVLLPAQLTDPIPVVVQATNVPVPSPVSIAFSGTAGATSTTANLAGTTASSTATVMISGVSRSGLTYLFVSTTFSASQLSSNIDMNDPHGLSKIELAAAPGKKTKYRFLEKDGTELSAARIPADIRRLFGM